MAFDVKFTKKAELDFEIILHYVENEFGSQTAIHFKNLIIEFASLLQNFPEIGSLELVDKNIRGL